MTFSVLRETRTITSTDIKSIIKFKMRDEKKVAQYMKYPAKALVSTCHSYLLQFKGILEL
jgi:hypothetical protein